MQFNFFFQLKCTKQVNGLVYGSENIREKPHTHSKTNMGQNQDWKIFVLI